MAEYIIDVEVDETNASPHTNPETHLKITERHGFDGRALHVVSGQDCVQWCSTSGKLHVEFYANQPPSQSQPQDPQGGSQCTGCLPIKGNVRPYYYKVSVIKNGQQYLEDPRVIIDHGTSNVWRLLLLLAGLGLGIFALDRFVNSDRDSAS